MEQQQVLLGANAVSMLVSEGSQSMLGAIATGESSLTTLELLSASMLVMTSTTLAVEGRASRADVYGLYATLSQRLLQAVESSAYSAALQALAADRQVVAMQTATAVAASTSLVSPKPGLGDDPEGGSGWKNAYVAVLVVGMCACAAIAIGAFCRRARADGDMADRDRDKLIQQSDAELGLVQFTDWGSQYRRIA